MFESQLCSRIRASLVIVAILLPLGFGSAVAEPYLAVQKGLQCSACHTHPAGGGKRSVYGNVFTQSEQAAERVGGDDQGVWTGEIGRWLGVGANLRGGYRYVDTPNAEEVSEFDITRGTVYLEARLIPDRLSVYVDQQVAPNASINREVYVKLRDESGKFQLTAGQFYLPYGLRLQDDSAFVRQTTGINFTNPDRGVQLGYEQGPWSTIVSITNGSGGGRETDTGKQVSFVTVYVQRQWRLGFSVNANDDDGGDRQMGNVFAGVKTGPIAWLAEVDLIEDDLPLGGKRDAIAGLLEGNWLIQKGHNLKVSYDYFDPDDDVDEDHQARWSLVWEYMPMQFLQGRFGVRIYDGVPQVDAQNRDVFFAELHGFF